MCYFTWLVIGIILFLITWYVHAHTYAIDDYYNYYRKQKVIEKVKVPLWVFLLAIITVFIPILNLTAFILGIIAYIISVGEKDIELRIEWVNKVTEFLNKKV